MHCTSCLTSIENQKKNHAPINKRPTMTLKIVIGGVRAQYAQKTVLERRRSKGESASVSVSWFVPEVALVEALARWEIYARMSE